VEGIELPSALALLLRANLLGARERPFERGLQLGLVGDLAADVADEAAEPRAQQTQLPMVTLELLGMSIARSHHRRVLGDARIRLPQPYSAFIGQTIEPLDCGMQQFGIGREGDGLGLHGSVHRHPLEVTGTQRAGLMRQA
jgi:hypothetical protein